MCTAPLEYIQIKDLVVGMKNINTVFIVLDVGLPTLTKDGKEVRTLRVADSTAYVNFSVWDEPGTLLQPGDIVRLQRGYANLWRQCLTLYCSKNGDIQKIDEFCMLFNEDINMSKPVPLPPPGSAAGGAAGGAAGAAACIPAIEEAAPMPNAGAPIPHAGLPGYGPDRFAADRDSNHARKTYERGRGSYRAHMRR